MARASKTVGPMLVVMLMLVLDLSVGVSAIVPQEETSNMNQNGDHGDLTAELDNEIPLLICDGEVCPEKFRGIGFPPWDANPAVEEPYWWMNFNTDKDSNGMEDSLQYMIAGQKESHSATAILGEDGRMTLSLIHISEPTRPY